jgi:phosphoribosylformylglycinamidine synthase
MKKPKTYILWTPGTNCHQETKFALDQVGAEAEIILLNQVLRGEKTLFECDLFILPGGFGWGDHIGAGRICAIDLVHGLLLPQFSALIEKKIPILGICNGFQVLAATGALTGKLGEPKLLLDQNSSARFEHWNNTRVVIHEVPGCVWTKGLDGLIIRMPVAHGEGRPVWNDDEKPIWNVAATYGTYDDIADYPTSPNGSHIAGIAYKQIFGLMPHPERNLKEGRAIFEAGVNAVKG